MSTLSLIKRYGKKIKNAAIDVTSDVISAPTRAYYGVKTRYANEKYAMIKSQNAEQKRLGALDAAGVPDKGNESDPLFRYRVNKINKP